MPNRILSVNLALALACTCCLGQGDVSPHFEVASVKPVLKDVGMGFFGGPGSADPERITYSRIGLADLVAFAYNVRPNRISGPSWLDTEWYSVTAKLPPGATMDQFRQMMANLLTERFGLVFHRLSKDLSGYALVVARGGPKLTALPPEDPAATPDRPVGTGRTQARPDAKGDPWRVTYDGDVARMTFHQVSMSFLADRLGSAFNGFRSASATTPVVDKTGLTGRFDFHLEFTAPLSGVSEPAHGQIEMVATRELDSKTISTALQKQLGLQLNPEKIEVPFLIIDHVERVPTAN